MNYKEGFEALKVAIEETGVKPLINVKEIVTSEVETYENKASEEAKKREAFVKDPFNGIIARNAGMSVEEFWEFKQAEAKKTPFEKVTDKYK